MRIIALIPAIALIACATTAIALTGCKTQYRTDRAPVRIEPNDDMPAWVNNPPIDPQMLYAVGADAHHDRDRAIADARKDLTRQLRIVIRGETADDLMDEDDLQPGVRPRVSVDQLDLPGITVTRQEETTHAIYVMIAFNRAQWTTSLRTRIEGIDRDITAALNTPDNSDPTHPIGTAARRYQRLQPLVSEREGRIEQLEVADPGAPLPAAPASTASIRVDLARALESLSVELLADPSLEPIMPQLTAGCASLGLRIVPGSEAPTLRIKLQMTSTTMLVDGMERLDATFQSATETGKDRRNLGGITINVRASSTTGTIARDRLNRKIATRWNEYLERDFVGCLTRM